MKKTYLLIVAAVFILSFLGCESESEDSESSTIDETTGNCDSSMSTCVTIGIYTYSGGVYTDTNKSLIYTVSATCETWSRNANADAHSAASHLHYNAQDASTFNGTTMTWLEYGPELSQGAIDITCAAATGGVLKSVDLNSYTADKSFFVKIKSVSP